MSPSAPARSPDAGAPPPGDTLQRWPRGSSRWSAALLLMMMWSVSAALSGVAHGLEGTGSTLIVVLALTLGWLLARSGQPGPASAGVAVWVGLGLISLRIGRLGDEWARLAGSLAGWLLGALGGGATRVQGAGGELPIGPAALAPVEQALGALLDGYRVLISRFWVWLVDLAAGGEAIDPVASALAWSVLLWAAACWAVWWTWRRERPVAAVLPALALLGTTLYLSRSSHVYLLPPLGAALLLQAVAGHDSRQRRWTARAVPRSEGMLGTLALSAVPVTLLLVAAAAAAPDLSLSKLREFGRRVAGRPVAVSGGLPDQLGLSRASRPGTGFEPLLVAGLPNRHLIGSGPELSERLVMSVTLADPPPHDPVPRYYWRALTYDRYTGRGWKTSPLAVQALDAGAALIEQVPPNARLVLQRVQGAGELGGLAYSAGMLVSVDHAFELAWRELGRDPFAATLSAEAYWAESLVPQVTLADLRAAGSEYPGWVLESYLQLPPQVPARVRALARDLTATAATPYDRAAALERYLRAFPYTLDLPAPPADREVVDYFLFDLQRGYCDYYASAMAVLARAAGLPARLVVGYVAGEPTPTEGTVSYRVTEAEAHSWVEVYFPGIGWVEFEPTGGRPAIERRAETAPEAGDPAPPARGPGESLRALRWAALRAIALRGAAALVLATAAGGLGWLALDAVRLRRKPPAEAIAAAYRRLFRALQPLAPALSPAATPHELLAAYAARAGQADPLLRAGLPDARRLVELHVAAAYGPALAGEVHRAQALRAWRRLRPRLWLSRQLRLPQPRRRNRPRPPR